MKQTNEYFFLTESKVFDLPNKEDIQFLREYKDQGQCLIQESRNKFVINFVGEVVTPNYVYFSMPKNMGYTMDNVELVKNILSKYSRDKDGKKLVVSKTGSYNPERAYFDKLKGYYLDFITYEFIYPLKKKIVHQNSPIPGSKLSIIDTDRNRKRYGSGITYKVKNIKNSEDWLLDDIYYYTILDLSNKLKVSEKDVSEIKSMTKYLIGEGYVFNKIEDDCIISNTTNKILLDMRDLKKVIDTIQKSEVGVIHYPVKNILLEYYKYKKSSTTIKSLNVFFTRNFEKVWEMILQDALETERSKTFRMEMDPYFSNNVGNRYVISPSNVEMFKREYPLIDGESEGLDKWMEESKGRYFIIEKDGNLEPDIFVELVDGRRFIGDAKYYNNPIESDYLKEMYSYNRAQGNKYPMVIFASPKDDQSETKIAYPRGNRRDGLYELIILLVCVQDVVSDVINGTRKVLGQSVYLIDKYTRRKTWD